MFISKSYVILICDHYTFDFLHSFMICMYTALIFHDSQLCMLINTKTKQPNMSNMRRRENKGEYPLRFFLTVRNGFYCSLEISLTRERFTCSRARNKIHRSGSKKKVNSIQLFEPSLCVQIINECEENG